MQGVCTDRKKNWFFTQNGNLWKIPFKEKLTQQFNGPNSNGVEVIYTKDHLGDLDYFDGFLFVPIQRNEFSVRVYDAATLKQITYQVLPQVPGGPGWVAINPNNKLLYTSPSDYKSSNSNNLIYCYSINFEELNKAKRSGKYDKVSFLQYHSAVKLYQQGGAIRELTAMQGGCFDFDNHLHIINGMDKSDDVHIRVYTVSKNPIRNSTERADEILMSRQCAVSSVFEGFRYENSGTYHEPEGMTYFPTNKDTTPGISGSLHVLMLANGTPDKWYFKHYSEV